MLFFTFCFFTFQIYDQILQLAILKSNLFPKSTDNINIANGFHPRSLQFLDFCKLKLGLY